MRLKGISIIFLVASGFEDLEFWVPFMRLKEEGARVVVAAEKTSETIKGKMGLEVRSDISFDQVKTSEFTGLVVPGGWAPDKLRRDHNVKEILRNMHASGKVIGLICHAGLVGISAGIVKGVQATGSEGIKDDLINAGAFWVNKPAFRSGNLVWGRVVADIPDFCRELVNALVESDQSSNLSELSPGDFA